MRNRHKFFFFGWGFSVWLVATLLIRLFGESFFLPKNVWMIVGLFISLIPLIGLMTLPMYQRLKVAGNERLIAAVCMALPGMILDIDSILFHRYVFPGLSSDSVTLLAAWLFFGYVLIIVSGFFPEYRSAVQKS